MGQEMSVAEHPELGASQLISAIQAKDTEKVSELVEKMDSCEVNKLGEDGYSALHEACTGYNHEAVDILLRKSGMDINVKGLCGFTPLHVACGVNNHQAVRKLLTRPEIESNARSSRGYTPIMFAASFCQEEALKLMLGDDRVDLDTGGGDGRSLEELVGMRCNKEKCLRMIKEEKSKRSKKKEETGVEPDKAESSASPNVDNDESLCWSCFNSRRDEQMYKCGACKRVTAYCSRECLEKELHVHNNWCLEMKN